MDVCKEARGIWAEAYGVPRQSIWPSCLKLIAPLIPDASTGPFVVHVLRGCRSVARILAVNQTLSMLAICSHELTMAVVPCHPRPSTTTT